MSAEHLGHIVSLDGSCQSCRADSASLEATVVGSESVLAYSPGIMPFAVQTPAYRSAVISSLEEVTGSSHSVARVPAALGISDVATSRRHFWLLLEEQALHTRITARDSHRVQLALLLSLMAQPNVEVEVIPHDVKQRSLQPVSGFCVFDEKLAIIDAAGVTVTTGDLAVIRRLTKARSMLRTSSVFGDDARALIERAMGWHWNEQ